MDLQRPRNDATPLCPSGIVLNETTFRQLCRYVRFLETRVQELENERESNTSNRHVSEIDGKLDVSSGGTGTSSGGLS